MRIGAHAAVESLTPIHGLGGQLRSLANDPEAGLYVHEGTVLRSMPELAVEEPLIFTEAQQATCAVLGTAQVIQVYFPRHSRRG